MRAGCRTHSEDFLKPHHTKPETAHGPRPCRAPCAWARRRRSEGGVQEMRAAARDTSAVAIGVAGVLDLGSVIRNAAPPPSAGS